MVWVRPCRRRNILVFFHLNWDTTFSFASYARGLFTGSSVRWVSPAIFSYDIYKYWWTFLNYCCHSQWPYNQILLNFVCEENLLMKDAPVSCCFWSELGYGIAFAADWRFFLWFPQRPHWFTDCFRFLVEPSGPVSKTLFNLEILRSSTELRNLRAF